MSNKGNYKSFSYMTQEELIAYLRVDPLKGLSDQEAQERISLSGNRSFRNKKSFSSIKLFLYQFHNPLIYLLLFASILALILYDKTDAVIIFSIIFISAFLTFFQERGAARSMEALLKIVQVKATIVRNGIKKEIPIEQVAPGDIIALSSGDIIPGDCYLLESNDLYVDEASLTGESFNVEKRAGIVAKNSPLSKKTNSLFMGTHVVSGTAKAVVVHIGNQSEFGKIIEKLSHKRPKTEFESGISHFGYLLMEVTFSLLIIILAFNIYFGRAVIESVLFALALAVGLTPQLLPAIISVNLTQGAKRMAEKSVIVKRLNSIENFGSMTVLCMDKTGTLTTGQIKLEKALDIEGEESKKTAFYAYINAFYQSGYSNPIDHSLLQDTKDLSDWQKLDEIPYDFIRKKISIFAENKEEKYIISKGAFQQMIDICSSVESPLGRVDIKKLKVKLQKQFLEFSQQGYRVLAVAYRKVEQTLLLTHEDEKEMVFLGFLLFLDPLKNEIIKTIEELKQLGVALKIITGDNQFVAKHIANQLGLSNARVITGNDLDQMSDAALLHNVDNGFVFAEIEPNQKERIILALKKIGKVVGFLGDGINDVTALHAADVSISVDNGVDAAKEAADIVLLKKDLSILQDGVKIGRKTFANTLKYIFMATSANFGNMFSMAGASLFLSFLPLLPKQVLLINLLTDLPEMFIATDRVDQSMVERPLRWNIRFIRKFMLLFGLISSLFDFATFGILLWLLKASEMEFRTGWFVESVVSASLIVLIVRTFGPFYKNMPSKSLLISVLLVILATSIFPLTPLAAPLGLTLISWKFYLAIIAIVSAYVLVVEIAKKLFLKKLANGYLNFRT